MLCLGVPTLLSVFFLSICPSASCVSLICHVSQTQNGGDFAMWESCCHFNVCVLPKPTLHSKGEVVRPLGGLISHDWKQGLDKRAQELSGSLGRFGAPHLIQC